MAAQRRQGRFLRMHGDRSHVGWRPHGIEQHRQRRDVIEMRMGEEQMVHARQRLDIELADAGAGVDQISSSTTARSCVVPRRCRRCNPESVYASAYPVSPGPPGLQRSPGLCHHAVRPIMTNPALNFLALALYVAVGACCSTWRLVRSQGDATLARVSACSRSGRRRGAARDPALPGAAVRRRAQSRAHDDVFARGLGGRDSLPVYLGPAPRRLPRYSHHAARRADVARQWLWPGQAPMPLTSGFQAAHYRRFDSGLWAAVSGRGAEPAAALPGTPPARAPTRAAWCACCRRCKPRKPLCSR